MPPKKEKAEDQEQPTSQAESNGADPAHGSRGIPSTEDFYTSGEAGNVWNVARETIFMPSDDPSTYIPRSVLSLPYLQRYRAMQSRRQRMYTGFSDPQYADWIMLAGSVAIDGRARSEMVAIATGEQKMNFARRGLQNIGDRIKDVTNRETQQQ